MDRKVLENKFQNDIENGYYESKKIKYNPTYFWRMVGDIGAYQAAKKLIHMTTPSEGFTTLWELKRLDLSVEAVVLKPEYAPLFSDKERQICVERLLEYGYDIQNNA